MRLNDVMVRGVPYAILRDVLSPEGIAKYEIRECEDCGWLIANDRTYGRLASADFPNTCECCVETYHQDHEIYAGCDPDGAI